MDLLAELKTRIGQIQLVNMEMVGRGFGIASDTRLRIGEANRLIAAGEVEQTDDWRTEAAEMAELLRAEVGRV